MILDVGCGGSPKGDVNCDLFFGESPHTTQTITKAPNFIRCDAEKLPFRDESFPCVYSGGCVEHLKHPYSAIEEFSRVSQKWVYIKVPNSPGMVMQRKCHLYAWDATTLENLLREVFPRVEIYQGTPQNELLNGRVLGLSKLWLLRRFLSFLFRHLIANDLTAICRK